MIKPQPGGSLFEQLAAQLRHAITTGQIRPGQPLPSERTLQQQHHVARETVRRAVALLRNEGLVTAVRGHGLVVREQPELTDLSLPAGATVVARMPTAAEKADHDLEDGVPVFYVVLPDGTVAVYPADQYRLRLT